MGWIILSLSRLASFLNRLKFDLRITYTEWKGDAQLKQWSLALVEYINRTIRKSTQSHLNFTNLYSQTNLGSLMAALALTNKVNGVRRIKMRFRQDAAEAQMRQHAMTMVGRVLNVQSQEDVVEEVCLAETKVRVSLPCDKSLDFVMELEYEEEVISVKLKYEKLHGFCRICHKMTHDDNGCPLRVTRPEQDRGFNKRPNWEDRRDGRDRRHRNQADERNQPKQFRNRGESSNLQNGGRGANLARQPLQRQLLPEFTTVFEAREQREKLAAVEGRFSTKNWVKTAFGKVGKEGVVIDKNAIANFVAEASDHREESAAPVKTHEKTTVQEGSSGPIPATSLSPVVKSMSERRIVVAEATTKDSFTANPASVVHRETATQQEEKKGKANDMGSFRPIGPHKIISWAKPNRLGPSSAPLVKSWYEGTVEEEENEKMTDFLKGEGPFSAPNATIGFVSTGRDTQGNRLGIEEIISPLKDFFEVPNVIDPPKSRGKKVKKFNEALNAI
ncbi:unnamed protein product [Cochlearia groenlandica]